MRQEEELCNKGVKSLKLGLPFHSARRTQTRFSYMQKQMAELHYWD